MPRILVVHHSPSPGTRELFESVRDGAATDEVDGIEVVVRSALAATVTDVLTADGCLLGTPANIGYISGALKHFLDTIYYPVQDETNGRPWGGWVHGNEDTTGAVRALTSITKGLGWVSIADVVEVLGQPSPADREACWELGATLAATLAT